MRLKPALFAIAALGLVPAPLLAAGSLDGATVVITNTFQGPQTGGAETDVAAFGLANNQFSTVGAGVEFPDFITLYTVDISGDAIAFEWGNSDFAQQLTGPTPDGNHDRNYFVFDLPAGVAITGVSFDAEASGMIAGSADPKAAVLGPNRIVTDFDGGVIRGAGFNPVFKLSFD